MTDYLNAVWQDAHFNGFPLIVSLMIDGIGKGFLDCCDWIVEEPPRFGNIRLFNNALLNNTITDIKQCFSKLNMQRPFEDFLDNSIPAQIIRELDNIDLRIREKLVGFKTEKHKSNIFWFDVLWQRTHDIHASAQISNIHVS
jgi:hypothetical protein